MKKTILIFAVITTLFSCNKDYSLEYFNAYHADAVNQVMRDTPNFNKYIGHTVTKIAKDLFEVELDYIDSNNQHLHSNEIFNHSGKGFGIINPK